MSRRKRVALVVLWWGALFGLWPFAHPEHEFSGGTAGLIDFAVHLVCLTVLLGTYFETVQTRRRMHADERTEL